MVGGVWDAFSYTPPAFTRTTESPPGSSLGSLELTPRGGHTVAQGRGSVLLAEAGEAAHSVLAALLHLTARVGVMVTAAQPQREVQEERVFAGDGDGWAEGFCWLKEKCCQNLESCRPRGSLRSSPLGAEEPTHPGAQSPSCCVREGPRNFGTDHEQDESPWQSVTVPISCLLVPGMERALPSSLLGWFGC